MTTEPEDEWAMYLLVNKDLKMRGGKMASQVGHGVQVIVAACERAMAGGTEISPRLIDYMGWSGGGTCIGTKIILQATQAEMETMARTYEGESVAIYDGGRTTQIPSGSFTVLAFYPRTSSEETRRVFESFKLYT